MNQEIVFSKNYFWGIFLAKTHFGPKILKIEVPQNVQQFFYELFVLSYVGWAQLHRKTLKKNF